MPGSPNKTRAACFPAAEEAHTAVRAAPAERANGQTGFLPEIQGRLTLTWAGVKILRLRLTDDGDHGGTRGHLSRFFLPKLRCLGSDAGGRSLVPARGTHADPSAVGAEFSWGGSGSPDPGHILDGV